MTEPKRLLEEGGPSALLLASATDDGPSAAGFERTAKRLGLAGLAFGAATLTASSGAAGTAVGVSAGAGAGTSAGTGLATGAGAAGAAGAAGSGALGAGAGAAGLAGAVKVSGAAGVVGISMFAKVVGVATVCLAVAAGTVVATSGVTSTEPPAATRGAHSTPSLATLAEPMALPKPTEPSPVESLAPERTPAAAPDPDSAKPSSAKPPRVPGALASPASPASPATLVSPEDHALRDEVAILDEARAAISRGHSDAALSALARHRKEFPRGFLGSEADVLRVEALVKSGRTAEAKTYGEQLLAREPNGPQAKRVRSLLGI